jgi:hypothetical protein
MEETGRIAGEQEDVGDQEKKRRDQTLALFCSWRHVLVHRLGASAVLGAFFIVVVSASYILFYCLNGSDGANFRRCSYAIMRTNSEDPNPSRPTTRLDRDPNSGPCYRHSTQSMPWGGGPMRNQSSRGKRETVVEGRQLCQE